MEYSAQVSVVVDGNLSLNLFVFSVGRVILVRVKCLIRRLCFVSRLEYKLITVWSKLNHLLFPLSHSFVWFFFTFSYVFVFICMQLM